MNSGEIGVNYQGKSRLYVNNYPESEQLPASLKFSASNPRAIKPQGQQNLALSAPPAKAFNIIQQIKLNKNQKNSSKSKARIHKAAMAADTANEVINRVSSLVLKGMRMAKAGKMITSGTYKIPNETFERSGRAFEGINIATESIAFIKSAGETVYQAVRDITAHSKRSDAQSLLKNYNLEKKDFDSKSSWIKRDRLQQLMSKKGADLSRSKSQIAVDRLTEVVGLAEQASAITHSALLMAKDSSTLAAKSLPGLGIALTVMATVRSAIKTGSQVSALNNLAKAEAATKDPLLKALAGHIKQERTIHARTHLVNTAVNVAATGVAIGLAASGVGAPAAFIATGSVGATISIGEAAFTVRHKRQLAKKRKQSDQLIKTRLPLNLFASQNIGVAEKAFLVRLRCADGTQLKETITFLRDFGVTDTTIKKLQLAPEEMAIKTLREVLYQDKVVYKGLQLKQTVRTLAHVVGLSTLGKRIKAGSLWLVGKLHPCSGNQQRQVGASLLFKNRPSKAGMYRTDAIKGAVNSRLSVESYLRKRSEV